MKVRVHITLKPGVLDPPGRAVQHSLVSLGFDGVDDVRIGRTVEMDLADGTPDAVIDQMCRKLLTNLVIETYRIEKVPALEGA